MNVEITRNNIDISRDVISYNRTATMCSIIGTLSLQVVCDTDFTFIPYDVIRIYEGGSLKATYYVSTIENSISEGCIVITCQDESKKLEDYFIPLEYNVEDRLTYSKYWLSKILDDAHVTYTYETSEIGVAVSNYTTFGLCNAIENVIQLLQYSGWYMWFDATGTAHIGKIVINPEDIKDTLLDTTILHIETSQSDKQLRNRAVVWGAGDEESDQWVYASARIKTPYDVSENDVRTVVLSSGSILTNAVAQNLANKLLAETSSLTYIKTIEVAGLLTATIGQTVFVESDYYEGVGLVTSKSVSMSKDGLITTVVLDERCPRILGAYGYDGYVYIGTTEDGVWRKPLTGTHTWANYSTGLTDLNIKDLRIQNGIYAVVTSGGNIFTRRGIDSSWVRRNPSLYTDTLSETEVEYDSTEVRCEAATIKKDTSKIYSVYSTRDATVSGVIVATPWRSWISNSFFSPVQLFSELNYEIRVITMDSDSENIYCMYQAQTSGVALPGFNESYSQYGVINTTTNVTTFENVYISAPTVGGVKFSRIISENYCYYFDNGDIVRQHLLNEEDTVTIDASALSINIRYFDFIFASSDARYAYIHTFDTYYCIDFTEETITEYATYSVDDVVFPRDDYPAILGGVSEDVDDVPSYVCSGVSGNFSIGSNLTATIPLENVYYPGQLYKSNGSNKIFYLYMNFGDINHYEDYTKDAEISFKIIDKLNFNYGFTQPLEITIPDIFEENPKYTFVKGFYNATHGIKLNYLAGADSLIGQVNISERWTYKEHSWSTPATITVTWIYRIDYISGNLTGTMLDYEISGITPDQRTYDYTGPTLFYIPSSANTIALTSKFDYLWLLGIGIDSTRTFYSLDDEYPNYLATYADTYNPAFFLDDENAAYYTYITGEGTTEIYRNDILLCSVGSSSVLQESDPSRALFINGGTVYYIDNNWLGKYDTGLFALVPTVFSSARLTEWYPVNENASEFAIGVIDPILGGITELVACDGSINKTESSILFGTVFFGQQFTTGVDDPIVVQNLADPTLFIQLDYSSSERRCYDLKHFSLPGEDSSFSTNIGIVNENGIFYFDYNSARMDVLFYNDGDGFRIYPFTSEDIDRKELIVKDGVKHFETTNYSTGSPYMFYSTRIEDANAFYQRDENLVLPIVSGSFVLRNTSLPTSEITSIRCDDKI